MRRTSYSLTVWAWVLLLGCIGALALPSFAQDEEYVPDEDAEVESSGGETGSVLGDEGSTTDFDAIDDMLALDEEVLSDPDTYSYDPGARRDPFRSLLERRTTTEEPEEARPDGPAGLLIDEIEIQGIFVLPEGPVAQVLSSSQETSFLLREGDELWDGDVLTINLDEVVFKQEVKDPTSLKPFHEVRKKLNP